MSQIIPQVWEPALPTVNPDEIYEDEEEED
jgi:hypothetical protein